MKLRPLIIIVIIIIVIIIAGWLFYYFLQQPKQLQQTQQDYTSQTQESPSAETSPGNTTIKRDTLLWFADNDTTSTISYDLKRIPDDYSFNDLIDSLDQDVNSF